ncbi:MAG: methyltransferase domain-containing protein [Acidobacteriaceae bacterium]|nr:methyltransferase domain-containing protein [Acidobacteriaceae bacterium]MBV9502525.1 methyltransferase domain-containing protein [Acidobacteriaceae bacterium]
MSSASRSTSIDVEELSQNIREQIRRRSGLFSGQGSQSGVGGAGVPFPAELTESLRSLSAEAESLRSQVETGEPAPVSVTLRTRFGALIKRRLYRFLWWQSHQIRALVDIVSRQSRETSRAIDALFQTTRDAQRLVSDGETRLRQLESAQLRLQAAEIERNVKYGPAQLETDMASLRRELSEVSDALKLAEARLADQVRGDNALREQELGELRQRVSELAQQAQVETAQKEQMAARLSELGLSTHQTKATLSVQDRRLTLLIEEARKRLPEPLSEDQLRGMIAHHSDHRYDSLYVAFEDIFRGSREEIKARQSVYISFLKEHGIGSTAMLVLDLGCGRGEWLEVLSEHNLSGRGVDRNETMVECCKSAGFEAVQDDSIAYLSTLPDAALGAVTSFHMIEHLPFEVTLTLVDEALRVLKPGGVLILETPNPHNVLVGASTFHLDPTHLKPLPSPMLRFFVEARGFCDVHVRELHPYPATVRLPDDGKGLANRLNDYLYGPQDYAVIGRKP